MSDHSPEPWYEDEAHVAYDRDGRQLNQDKPLHIRNQRRSFACVNALAGLNPEAVGEMYTLLTEAVEDYDNHGPNVTSVFWLDKVREVLAKAKPAERKVQDET